ncbi:hypothetical protein PHYPSEUDO_015132 [Phytophthora pseudosyringae]|uniref:Uncharacterized protein n=1 Tax=Phytophthora pseudosyringae TaxID=221518 RepID=A0A8T1V6D5_9STRA|nr:hypothetical protein PHYPSEUDO_015132 [Phytophthora pseudosyringae]
MARTVHENPSCPDGRAVAQAQRDAAESEHSTIREKKRKLQSDALPPLPVYNCAVLEAHRAEKVARARDQDQYERWEKAALGEIFDIGTESQSDDSGENDGKDSDYEDKAPCSSSEGVDPASKVTGEHGQ